MQRICPLPCRKRGAIIRRWNWGLVRIPWNRLPAVLRKSQVNQEDRVLIRRPNDVYLVDRATLFPSISLVILIATGQFLRRCPKASKVVHIVLLWLSKFGEQFCRLSLGITRQLVCFLTSIATVADPLAPSPPAPEHWYAF